MGTMSSFERKSPPAKKISAAGNFILTPVSKISWAAVPADHCQFTMRAEMQGLKNGLQ
jgi:hypothetical protein